MKDQADPARFCLLNINDIEPITCPCGSSRRAFADDVDKVASLHLVESEGIAQTHFHKRMTEIYYILDGTGQIELDGKLFDVGPGSTILIKPGCRHRAIGNLRFLNVPIPAFDPDDEWFDD